MRATCPAPGDGQGRSYHSPFRQQQADETRRRILDAAAHLLGERGYAHMTIADIAKAARVSAPTIYAVFRSKRGILAELLDRHLHAPDLEAIYVAMCAQTDPREKIRTGTRLVRIVHESALPLDRVPMSGAGVIDPELVHVISECEQRRRECQEPLIAELQAAGHLRADLAPAQALDVLWALTGRGLYSMLCKERGWSGQQYEEWLCSTLSSALLR